MKNAILALALCGAGALARPVDSWNTVTVYDDEPAAATSSIRRRPSVVPTFTGPFGSVETSMARPWSTVYFGDETYTTTLGVERRAADAATTTTVYDPAATLGPLTLPGVGPIDEVVEAVTSTLKLPRDAAVPSHGPHIVEPLSAVDEKKGFMDANGEWHVRHNVERDVAAAEAKHKKPSSTFATATRPAKTLSPPPVPETDVGWLGNYGQELTGCIYNCLNLGGVPGADGKDAKQNCFSSCMAVNKDPNHAPPSIIEHANEMGMIGGEHGLTPEQIDRMWQDVQNLPQVDGIPVSDFEWNRMKEEQDARASAATKTPEIHRLSASSQPERRDDAAEPTATAVPKEDVDAVLDGEVPEATEAGPWSAYAKAGPAEIERRDAAAVPPPANPLDWGTPKTYDSCMAACWTQADKTDSVITCARKCEVNAIHEKRAASSAVASDPTVTASAPAVEDTFDVQKLDSEAAEIIAASVPEGVEAGFQPATKHPVNEGYEIAGPVAPTPTNELSPQPTNATYADIYEYLQILGEKLSDLDEIIEAKPGVEKTVLAAEYQNIVDKMHAVEPELDSLITAVGPSPEDMNLAVSTLDGHPPGLIGAPAHEKRDVDAAVDGDAALPPNLGNGHKGGPHRSPPVDQKYARCLTECRATPGSAVRGSTEQTCVLACLER